MTAGNLEGSAYVMKAAARLLVAKDIPRKEWMNKAEARDLMEEVDAVLHRFHYEYNEKGAYGHMNTGDKTVLLGLLDMDIGKAAHEAAMLL